jgi:hypothetical protein
VLAMSCTGEVSAARGHRRFRRTSRAHRDRPLGLGGGAWGLWSAEELPSKKTELAGNPSEVDRAAKLRKISLRDSRGRPESRRDVQMITRRVGDALLWPGGVCVRRLRPCRLRTCVRSAAFEVRSAEIGRGPQNATDRTRNSHNRPSPWRWADLHLPEPASGGNGCFLFRSCVV